MSRHPLQSSERRWIATIAAASPRWLVSGLAVVGFAAAGLHPVGRGAEAHDALQPKAHTVTIEGTSFQPEQLTISPGDTVVWVNKDPFPHTATSTTGAFDSGNIAPGKSWKFRATKKGELAYVCTLHPTMKARLTVE